MVLTAFLCPLVFAYSLSLAAAARWAGTPPTPLAAAVLVALWKKQLSW
jgi:hypothetical protein